jgi:hypothetical protein
MTAKTAQSHVAQTSPVGGSSDHVSVEHGVLASTYSVGAVVYQSASGVWTIQASNAGHLQRTGVVGYKPRTSSTWARCDIDTAYTTSDEVPIITSGICIAAITDQNGALAKDTFLGLGTAGSFTVLGAYTTVPRARLMEDLIDNDVFGLVGIGDYLWHSW